MLEIEVAFSSSTIVLTTLFALFFAYRLYRSFVNYHATDVHYIAKPSRGHWLWGHELEPLTGYFGEVYASWFDRIGPVVRMRGSLIHGDMLTVADPAIISHVLGKHAYDYPKSPIFRPIFERTLGRGLAWAEGDEHKRMRALLNPVFSAEQTRGMFEGMKFCTDRMVAAFVTHVNNRGGDTIVQARDWTSRATLDIIGRVAFGHDFCCGESAEARQICRVWIEMVDGGMTMSGRIAPLILRNFPFLLLFPIPAIRAQSAVRLTVQGLAEQLIAKAPKDPELIKGGDLLTTLMRANIREHMNISREELLDHICAFILLGHETTAGTLNFTLHALAQNPDLQDKLRREIVSFGAEPTYQDFQNKLPYLDAVVKEGLRMFPPGAHTERVAARDDVLPLGKPLQTSSGKVLTSIRIKKGQLLSIPTIAINRNNAVWGDGWTFRPERWLTPRGLPDPSESVKGLSQLLSFLDGPRMCIGYRVALLEFKIILSSLIKTFVFHDTGAKMEPTMSPILQPRIIGEKGSSLPLRVTLAEP